MAELKTKKTDDSVGAFIDSIEDESKRRDCLEIVEMMRTATGQEPNMWGQSIIGFGTYQYKYQTGREGVWFRVGLSPRKQNITLYFMDGFEKYEKLLNRLGKHKTGKSCLYIKRLSDIDKEVLNRLIEETVSYFAKKYGKE